MGTREEQASSHRVPVYLRAYCNTIACTRLQRERLRLVIGFTRLFTFTFEQIVWKYYAERVNNSPLFTGQGDRFA